MLNQSEIGNADQRLTLTKDCISLVVTLSSFPELYLNILQYAHNIYKGIQHVYRNTEFRYLLHENYIADADVDRKIANSSALIPPNGDIYVQQKISLLII